MTYQTRIPAAACRVTYDFAGPVKPPMPTLSEMIGADEFVSEGDEEVTLGELLSELPVAVFTKSACPYCTQTKTLLDRMGIGWIEIPVEELEERKWLYDTLALEEAKRTVPQIFIRGTHVGGYLDLVSAVARGDLFDFQAAA